MNTQRKIIKKIKGLKKKNREGIKNLNELDRFKMGSRRNSTFGQ